MLARRCKVALSGLAAEARSFARALVFLRGSDALEPLMAGTIDAARPLVDLVRSYPATVCLPTPAPGAGAGAARCAKAGRDVAVVIREFEQSLDRWRVRQ